MTAAWAIEVGIPIETLSDTLEEALKDLK